MPQILPRILLATILSALFSQSAEFTQQYLQRLGGAADELAVVVERFDAEAGLSNLSREAAIRRLTSNPDGFVARQGVAAARSAERLGDLTRRYGALIAAAPLLRPLVAAGDPDLGIMRRTAEDFRPALPATADGLLLTLFGFLAGWIAGAGLAGAGTMIRRRGAARHI